MVMFYTTYVDFNGEIGHGGEPSTDIQDVMDQYAEALSAKRAAYVMFTTIRADRSNGDVINATAAVVNLLKVRFKERGQDIPEWLN
jgi:hypothetical protein